MKAILVICICWVNIFAFGQDSLVVQFQLIDKKTSDFVQNVNVTVMSKGDRVGIFSSNHKGIASFKIPIQTATLTASFSHPTYTADVREVVVSGRRDDTIKVLCLMTSIKVHYIGEVVVKPVGVPYTVFGSSKLSVSDFEIQDDGTMILLTYAKRLEKGSELLVYNGVDVVNSFQVPGVAQELKRDFRGNSHIMCQDNVYAVRVEDNQVKLSTITKEYYSKYVMPIVDTNLSTFYFSNFNPLYPAFDYLTFDQLDSAYGKITSVEDPLMMELYRAEYKWMDVRTKLWARQKQMETGIDAEIWVGANYFTRSIYYKELYAPMFHKDDTLFVFDYYKDKLFRFNAKGDVIDSVAIFHHYQPRITGWKKDVFQDIKTGEIYARFEKGGYTYIGRIDLVTGEIKERIQLEYQWVDKVMVYDNFVYYIYRPLESTQKKYLYKERLPYEFKSKSSL